MKKNKYDLFLFHKRIKKNKLLNTLSTLNEEKKRLSFIKQNINKMLIENNAKESEEIFGSDIKVRATFRENLIRKLEISNNRENHVIKEMTNNLLEIEKIEKQKEKINEKKKIIKIKKDNLTELRKENYFKGKNTNPF